MNRVTAYIAGVVTALAVCAGGLGIVTAQAVAPTALSEPNEIAARFDLQIVWYDKGTGPMNCGADVSGCFVKQMPDIVFVQRGLGDLERSVILHEIGHAVHFRLGLPSDECAADDFAESLGATWLGYAEECD